MMTIGIPPAEAATSGTLTSDATSPGFHTMEGHLNGNPCATYRNYRFFDEFENGSVTVSNGSGSAPYTGPITAEVHSELLDSNGNVKEWYEFADGSHAVSDCSDTVGATISDFTVSITGRTPNSNGGVDELDCASTPGAGTYKRFGGSPPGNDVNFEFPSASTTCRAKVGAAADGTGGTTVLNVATQINFKLSFLTVFLPNPVAQDFSVCNSPITPFTCVGVTRGPNHIKLT